MKKYLFLLLITLLCLSSCNKSQKSQSLKIYSIIHEEETKILAELFTKQTGIKVEYLRASTGELVNRVLTEKDNPQADILLGGTSNYHIQLEVQGALQNYVSPLSKDFPSYTKSQNGNWTGFCVLALAIGINKNRFNQKYNNQTIPQTWEDLLNPLYKDEIVVTNPISSSTGYLFVQNQLQRLGWEQGWNYLLELSKLVGQFPDSGGAPAKLVGTGEYCICVSYLHALEKYKAQGFDLQTVVPPKSVCQVDCISIMKNSKNQEYAKKFVDFILSKEAQQLMTSMDYTMPLNTQVQNQQNNILDSFNFIDFSSSRMQEQQDEVLQKWAELIN